MTEEMNVPMETVNVNAELDQVSKLEADLKQVTKERDQYRAALEAQVEKYNKLFGLFANNVDYIIGNTNQGN